jgi:hypothetical protein
MGHESKVSGLTVTVRIRTTSDGCDLRFSENDALEHVKPRTVFVHDFQGRIDG